jgi:hypothetical protein
MTAIPQVGIEAFSPGGPATRMTLLTLAFHRPIDAVRAASQQKAIRAA